jgi:hypothetical protein
VPPARSGRRSRTAASSESQAQWLDLLETFGEVDRCVSVAWVAGGDVAFPEDELNEALRRALVVRAVGGAPDRELTLEDEAVVRLAAELDGAEPRASLRRGLESLRGVLAARPAAAATLDVLLADGDLAWRCFAAGNLAEELGRDG